MGQSKEIFHNGKSQSNSGFFIVIYISTSSIVFIIFFDSSYVNLVISKYLLKLFSSIGPFFNVAASKTFPQ